MLPPQRRQLILDRVRTDGGVRVSDLGTELDVSDMTIRRDLAVLAEQGLVRKTHGGATVAEPAATEEPGFLAKSQLQRSEKAAIAAAAAALVEPGDAIAISAGTTTLAVAQHLLEVPDLTVVTNSVPAAELFHTAGRSDQTILLTGGMRTPSDALVGPLAEAALRQLHVNTTILGVHGMSRDSGLTTPNLQEAQTNRALIACGRRLVVVADHTKWDVVGISSMAPMEAVDLLVTDAGSTPEQLATVRDVVAAVSVVEVNDGAETG